MSKQQPHPRVLCIWLPNWPIQRVGAAEPLLANGPLLLSTNDARRGLIVAAVNLAGREAGIRPAMRMSEAAALVDKKMIDVEKGKRKGRMLDAESQATAIREYDPQEDIDALCALAEQAQQFSPIVGLEQLDKKMWAGRTLPQPESLLLDVTGIGNLFGGEVALLEEVSQWLAKQNYFGCLGLAGSIGAAWGLANYGVRSAATQTAASSVGSIVPACRFCRSASGEDLLAMADLPVAALRLQPETVHSLQRLGIRSIGQLEQLPRAGLGTRLGEHLLLRWDQAVGRQREPLVTLQSLPDWSLEQTLEYPTQHRETIVELVRRLCHELSARLGRRGEGALRLLCRLDLVGSPPLVMQLGLFRPSGDAEHLELLLTGQLEQQLRSGMAAPLWRLGLVATLTAPLVWRQVDLFDSGEVAGRQQIARLVDTLSSRLGRKQVLSAKVRREAQPELGCTLQPMTGRRPEGRGQDTIRKLSSRLAHKRAEPSRDDPQRRPTQLFSPPLEIQVAGRSWAQAEVPGDTKDRAVNSNNALAACPARFQYQGVWLDVLDSTGPERLESGWWRGPSARRDYYRVITRHGGWWWLYRDLSTGKWYLHGAFD